MSHRQTYVRLLSPLLGRATAYARSILRNRHDADDAVQQASIRAMERFDTYDPALSFKAWWFAILRNCCIDLLRSNKAAKTETLDDHDAHAPEHTDESQWQRIAAAMSELSDDHREVLRLKYFADQSYREIAETLGIPQGTVMSRLYLARKALAARFNEESV